MVKRTTPFKDRRTMGYIYGGSTEERIEKTDELKEEGCYMVVSSANKNEKIINYIHHEYSGNGRIVCLYKFSPYSELVR